jgi:hypothetical protein
LVENYNILGEGGSENPKRIVLFARALVHDEAPSLPRARRTGALGDRLAALAATTRGARKRIRAAEGREGALRGERVEVKRSGSKSGSRGWSWARSWESKPEPKSWSRNAMRRAALLTPLGLAGDFLHGWPELCDLGQHFNWESLSEP